MRDWRFPCRVQRVVDGGTLDVLLDIGFNLTKTTRVRLEGVDRAFGDVARAATVDWLDRHAAEARCPFELQTHTKEDQLGRCLGTLYAPDDFVSLNDFLRTNGLAAGYQP